MIIGIDVDGVLADFNHDFMEIMVKVTGRNLFPAGYLPPIWDYPQLLGYTADELSAVWHVIEQHQHFWEQLPAYPHAKDLLSELRFAQKRGHPVYFITSRPSRSARFQTEHWLNRHGFAFPTVLVASAKGVAAMLLHLDWYADDKLDNCIDTMPFCYTVLAAQSWNTVGRPVTLHVEAPQDLAAIIKGF